MSRISKVAFATLLGSTALTTAQVAHAQAEPASLETAQTDEAQTGDSASGAEEIIVTGTRETGTRAADSATPIALLSASALEKVGQPNLNQALTQLVPSFQAQTQGTDMASFSLSA